MQLVVIQSNKVLRQARKIFGECVTNAFIGITIYPHSFLADNLAELTAEARQAYAGVLLTDTELDIDDKYPFILEFNGTHQVVFNTSEWSTVNKTSNFYREVKTVLEGSEF